jgi:TonB family protein
MNELETTEANALVVSTNGCRAARPPGGIIAAHMQPLPDPVAPARNPAAKPIGSLAMEVAWQSPWEQFRSSLHSFLKEPRAPKTGPFSGSPHLCIHWIEGKLPGRAFTASTLWHIAAVWVLTLPIWGFLPSAHPLVAPVQFELTWNASASDLPHISLPVPLPKPKPAATKRAETPAPEASRGADAYHPRQTILSIPVQVTHPRQTLIQPDAPAAPPKITEQLPNLVEWTATSPQPKPKIELASKAAAPVTKRRDLRDTAAPDIPNRERNPGPLNIASSPVVNPAPQLAMNPTAAPISQQRRAEKENAAAPEIAPEASAGDSGLRRMIALSADPAPPAPVAEVPRGNLAARVAISPEGTKPGTPGGSAKPAASSGGAANGPEISAAGTGKAGGESGSLPAAVSVTGGSEHRATGGGGVGVAGNRPMGRINLHPMLSYRPDSMDEARKGPSVTGAIDPNIAPDKILSGKEVYTMQINMPNLTSSTGSWTLNFAQLDEGEGPELPAQGRLAAPALERKVDPEYPPSMIKQHVEGQVILYAIIRKDGSVDSIQRVRGLEPQLDKNAMEALAQWKFRPATRNGVPVDIEAIVFIPFRYHAPNF